MNTLNRKKQPAFNQINTIDIIKAQNVKLANGIPVCLINAGTQDVVKIDFVFNAGSWEQDKPLEALFTNMMITEGTAKYKSSQIADVFDFYGAYLSHAADKHYASISLLVLTKHLEKTLPVVEEILKRSIFPEKEFSTIKQKEKDQFVVENEKVKTIARNKFSQLLYGENHPYGKIAVLSDFDKLTTRQLKGFYERLYHGGNCTIFISGKINDSVIPLLEKYFGGKDWKRKAILKKDVAITGLKNEKKNLIKKVDAVQSAIRVGKVLFNKRHPDFLGMQVLNTILGGYFGSRLMSNIREDKGYTYGIGSVMVSLKNSGFFVIVSEVGAEFSANTIKEINFELKKLRTEIIPEEELSLVRNYILGEMLNNFDGPFAIAEAYKGIMEYGLDIDYFNKAIETIKTIQAKDLKRLAKEHLHEDSMIQVIAGK
jgi:predicted Zn-dependent peptidase